MIANPTQAASASRPAGDDPRSIRFVSVVLPCLNEEAAVAAVIASAFEGLAAAGLDGEVLVVDNGSSDRSAEIAGAAGARVIHEPARGYGAAHQAGLAVARGDVVVMADADATYDLAALGRVVEPLRGGADLVLASRLSSSLAADAMPWLHRMIGTPVITRALRAAAGVDVTDSQSGYRAFLRDRMLGLKLDTPGMEHASEMLLQAGRAGLTIEEVALPYHPRVGESKLRTWSDGWRHLRLLLLLSPHLTLVFPGLALMLAGLLLSLLTVASPQGIVVGDLRWLPVFAGPMLLIIGAQAAFLGAIASRRYALPAPSVVRWIGLRGRLDSVDSLLRWFALLGLAGIVADAGLFGLWVSGASSDRLLGLAGLAQAAIVISAGGLAATLAADVTRESIRR